jgi:hypothetical protein
LSEQLVYFYILQQELAKKLRIRLATTVRAKLFLFFTGATTLCGSWPPPRFRISKDFQGGVVSPHAQPPTWRTRDNTSSGPYPLTCLAWVGLPGAYAPASIALRVIGAHKPPVHDKAVVLEEGMANSAM